MNNDNVIKLVNENGVYKEYGRIPDLWHIAMKIADHCDYGTLSKEACEEVSEMILQVWHMTHDLKSVVERQNQAKLIEPKPAADDQLIKTIARMNYDGEEMDDGSYFDMISNDAVKAVNSLIRKARSITEIK